MNIIQQESGMTKYMFQHQENSKLGAKQLVKMLRPEFAPEGNSRRSSQEIVLSKLIDFIIRTEGL